MAADYTRPAAGTVLAPHARDVAAGTAGCSLAVRRTAAAAGHRGLVAVAGCSRVVRHRSIGRVAVGRAGIHRAEVGRRSRSLAGGEGRIRPVAGHHRIVVDRTVVAGKGRRRNRPVAGTRLDRRTDKTW